MGCDRDRRGACWGAGRARAGCRRGQRVVGREAGVSSLEGLRRVPQRSSTGDPGRRGSGLARDTLGWSGATGVSGALPRPPRVFVLPIGVALSRDRFDAELVETAIGSGARFLPETRAQVGETLGGIRQVRLTSGGQLRLVGSRVVLAASGLGGSCLPPAPPFRVRIARGSRIGAGCRVTITSSGYEEGTIFMAVARQGYVGLVRVEDGSLNVAAAFEPELVRRHGTMAAAASSVLAEAGLPAIDELESARWQGTPATDPANSSDRCRAPLPAGRRRRLCRAVHRRRDRLGSGVWPGDRSSGPSGASNDGMPGWLAIGIALHRRLVRPASGRSAVWRPRCCTGPGLLSLGSRSLPGSRRGRRHHPRHSNATPSFSEAR